MARTDLKMGKGKLAAQVAHASLGAAEEAMSVYGPGEEPRLMVVLGGVAVDGCLQIGGRAELD